jgi:trk system potassium uptake protein TrkH
MRIKVILHYSGLVLTIVGLMMLIPLVCSILYQEADRNAFIIASAISIVLGLVTTLITPSGKEKLSIREALAIVGASWIIGSAFSAIPYTLAGAVPNYLDAFFEAMSGFTTTGATVLHNIESQPHGILLWRSFTQWLGGVGIISLFVAILPMMGIGPAHLVQAEAPASQAERFSPKIRSTVRALWQIYGGITVILVALLFIAGMPLFDAFTTSFSTVASGGFPPGL